MRDYLRKDLAGAAFTALFTAYLLVQALCLWRVLKYFPNGFESEGYYWPLAIFIASDGWSGAIDYLRGEMPTEIGFSATFRPPLYSFMLAPLAAISGDEVAALIFNNVALSATVLIVRKLGLMLGPVPGLAAPLLVMLDPLYLTTANASQSDMLFTALMSAFALLMARALRAEPAIGRTALASIALAAAILTRNAGLYISVAALAALASGIFRGVAPRALAATLLVFVAVQAIAIGSWMARNYAVTGNPDFAGGSTGAYLIGYFAPQVIARRDGVSFADAKRNLMAKFGGDPEFTALPQGEQERRQVAAAARVARDNPGLVLLLALENLPKLFLSSSSQPLAVFLDAPSYAAWLRFEAGEFNRVYEASFSSLERKIATARAYFEAGAVGPLLYGAAHKAVNGLALALGAIGLLWMCVSGQRTLIALGVFFLLYVAAMSAIISLVPAARFRLPVTPVLYVAAGWAAAALWSRLHARRRAEQRA